jgi:hypothetical protein
MDTISVVNKRTRSGAKRRNQNVIPKIPPGWYSSYHFWWLSTSLRSSSNMILSSWKATRIGRIEIIQPRYHSGGTGGGIYQMRIPPVIRNFIVQALHSKIKKNTRVQPAITSGMIFLFPAWTSIFRFKNHRRWQRNLYWRTSSLLLKC